MILYTLVFILWTGNNLKLSTSSKLFFYIQPLCKKHQSRNNERHPKDAQHPSKVPHL